MNSFSRYVYPLPFLRLLHLLTCLLVRFSPAGAFVVLPGAVLQKLFSLHAASSEGVAANGLRALRGFNFFLSSNDSQGGWVRVSD